MPLANLAPAQSRRAAVGIAAALALVIVAAIAIPVWLLHRHYDAALAESIDKLERYRRIAGTRTEVARQLEAMRARDTRKFFLRSGGAALSAAEAQEAIRSIVEANGGKLITVQAPASKEEGRYRQVTVNVQLTANVFALRKILHTIENYTPYLFVDNLKVTTQVPPNHRPGPGQEPEMFVTFDVLGYALTGA